MAENRKERAMGGMVVGIRKRIKRIRECEGKDGVIGVKVRFGGRVVMVDRNLRQQELGDKIGKVEGLDREESRENESIDRRGF